MQMTPIRKRRGLHGLGDISGSSLDPANYIPSPPSDTSSTYVPPEPSNSLPTSVIPVIAPPQVVQNTDGSYSTVPAGGVATSPVSGAAAGAAIGTFFGTLFGTSKTGVAPVGTPGTPGAGGISSIFGGSGGISTSTGLSGMMPLLLAGVVVLLLLNGKKD
jgi:hypothetical protein